ncbi:MAG: hypothetical protein HPY71_00160 [Firmicutes bacterium]|nr:hypothetical protein [Bacillota bacterium]
MKSSRRLRRWWYKQLAMNYGRVMAYLLTIIMVFSLVGLMYVLARFMA